MELGEDAEPLPPEPPAEPDVPDFSKVWLSPCSVNASGRRRVRGPTPAGGGSGGVLARGAGKGGRPEGRGGEGRGPAASRALSARDDLLRRRRQGPRRARGCAALTGRPRSRLRGPRRRGGVEAPGEAGAPPPRVDA